MTLEEILVAGLTRQGFIPFPSPNTQEPIIPAGGSRYINLAILAQFLSAHVVVGGKSKEQIPDFTQAQGGFQDA